MPTQNYKNYKNHKNYKNKKNPIFAVKKRKWTITTENPY